MNNFGDSVYFDNLPLGFIPTVRYDYFNSFFGKPRYYYGPELKCEYPFIGDETIRVRRLEESESYLFFGRVGYKIEISSTESIQVVIEEIQRIVDEFKKVSIKTIIMHHGEADMPYKNFEDNKYIFSLLKCYYASLIFVGFNL